MSASAVPTDSATPVATLVRQAQQVRTGLAPVPSPCQSVCRMDEERGWCAGCLRTRDELRAWRELDDAGKRAIWALVEQRLAVAGQGAPA